jgi:hypothetical protein
LTIFKYPKGTPANSNQKEKFLQSLENQEYQGADRADQVLIGQSATTEILIGQRVRRIIWGPERGKRNMANVNTICHLEKRELVSI